VRTLFRWIFRIALVLVVVGFLSAIALLLLKDSMTKSLAERNLRDGTGMDAKVGKLEVGLLTPTVNLEGLKMYNRPEFGGGVFLDMPELRLEYVPESMRSGKLHLKTVRLHIAEVNVVKNKEGKTNIEAVNKEASRKTGGQKKDTNKPGMDFGGIDIAYVTIGKVRITDLSNPKNNREINVGMKEEVGRNLKTEAEVTAWLTLAVAKSLWRESAKQGSTQDLGTLLELIVPKGATRR
jgi:hypothetical protein